jgi:hypothetical protein
MTSQRLMIVLTAVNLVLLVFLLAQTRIHIGSGGVRLWTNIQGSVIRGRSLEIVDDEGRVRASVMVHSGDTAATAPSGGTAILRLVDEKRPAVGQARHLGPRRRARPRQRFSRYVYSVDRARVGRHQRRAPAADSVAAVHRPTFPSAPNPKFAHIVPQKRLRASGSKGALES